jgi:hypothetical protein
MTNTTQTEPLSLLDGVEPDFIWHKAESGNSDEDDIFDGDEVPAADCPNCHNLYSQEKLEPVIKARLEAQRAEYEARIDANRKEVLLESAEHFENMNSIFGNISAKELRRMALGPTGVDKGEGSE